MPEDIGINSGAATFEIANKIMEICFIATVYIAHEFISFHTLLINFPALQGIDSYTRCFMTVLVTIFMQILNNLFCPAFTNNFLHYSPTNYEKLITLFYVVMIIIPFEMMISSLFLSFSDNRYYRYTIIVLGVTLRIYVKFCIACATLNVFFRVLKELEQLY